MLITNKLTLSCRYNPYDRAPLSTLPPEDVIPFCVSYDALTDVIQERDSGWWVKLRAGRVLLVDNWRVLHGRSAFTGVYGQTALVFVLL